jgi:hypothetical protein
MKCLALVQDQEQRLIPVLGQSGTINKLKKPTTNPSSTLRPVPEPQAPPSEYKSY